MTNWQEIMLYLIRTFGRKKTGLKVGFTDKLEKRLKQYLIENPYFELISTRQGTREDEVRTHLYLSAQGLKENYLQEWFIDCPETLKEFHVDQNKRDRTIWNQRHKLFSPSDFARENIKLKIYEELRHKHNGEKLNSGIDWEWKKWANKKYLKATKFQYM
jgi:hypothetical protein